MRTGRPHALAAALLAAAALVPCRVVDASAQQPDAASAPAAAAPAAVDPSGASPFLPAGHWAIAAARRLHGLGLMPRGYDPGEESQLLAEVAEGFRGAAAESSLAADYHARLTEEWGELAQRRRSLAATASVGFGGRVEEGGMWVGRGLEVGEPDWIGPAVMPDLTTAYARIGAHGRAGRLAWGADAGVDERGADVQEAYLLGRLGATGVWAGVRGGGLSAGPAGGAVLTGLEGRPGIGVHLVEPVRLPWILRHLGPVRFATSVYRASANGDFAHPWLWSARGVIEPHPRLQIGLNRGVMFGGEGNQEPELGDFLYMLIGKHTDHFDNQIVALTVRYRLPTPWLPLLAHLEWGAEDSAGAWRDVPGVIGYLEAPAVPGVPALALGVGGAYFGGACCGNPEWYRNYAFDAGWSDDGILLGHPLGGHGREALGYGRLDLLDARLQLDGRAFVRDRGSDNVYAPDREGASFGAALFATILGGPSWQGSLGAELEEARDGRWRRSSLRAAVTWRP